MKFSEQRKSLLSSQARIQIPWVKVTIGDFTFGIFSRRSGVDVKDKTGVYRAFHVSYPNYVQSLTVTKINGQVNQYSLVISYPVTMNDDPNFFEKVFSSVSGTRKIVFSYGDCSQPAYLYKDEEAIITGIQQQFDLARSTINYTISAISGAALKTAGNISWISSGRPQKPSDEIKRIFNEYNLRNTFTGMTDSLDKYIAGDDQYVTMESKRNISALDAISYLAGCMIPSGTSTGLAKDIYLLTIHDEVLSGSGNPDTPNGPYFTVKKTSYVSEQSDAYELDIGYNTNTIVSNFAINQNENYALYYDYQNKISDNEYMRRLNKQGQWEDVYAPTVMAKGDGKFSVHANDITWWTKITKYPIQAQVTVQGLLRPATLMSYLRLNVIFPGGNKHISSGLYLVTKQVDQINMNGYQTTLDLVKISGDNYISTNPSGR